MADFINHLNLKSDIIFKYRNNKVCWLTGAGLPVFKKPTTHRQKLKLKQKTKGQQPKEKSW